MYFSNVFDIVSQVRNSMETKTEQSFELLEVRNKSKLLQKYIHALQMNLQFIVTLVEGYIPVVIGSKAIMHECKKKIYHELRYYQNLRYIFANISWMKKKSISPMLTAYLKLD